VSDTVPELQVREFTVAEFHRMAEAGIIRPEERVELLDARLVRMPPIGVRHWDRHAAIVQYLNGALRGRAKVVGQGSFPLGFRSEPQPDVALLAPGGYELEERAPTPREIFALIGLAESSLALDFGCCTRAIRTISATDAVSSSVSKANLYSPRSPMSRCRPQRFCAYGKLETSVEQKGFQGSKAARRCASRFVLRDREMPYAARPSRTRQG